MLATAALTPARRLLALAAGVIASLLLANAGTAFAASGYASWQYASYGDCTLMSAVYQDNGVVYGGGNANCSARHATTRAYVTLKQNGTAIAPPAIAEFSNSFGMGSRVLWTPGYPGRCQNWQTVTTFYISGLGTTYLTSGSPKMVC